MPGASLSARHGVAKVTVCSWHSDQNEDQSELKAVTVSFPSADQSRSRSHAPSHRLYRLVDLEGEPHPVLDDLYDSLDSAWNEALAWWNEQFGTSTGPVGIGVEVSTTSGEWRTLRYPGS